MGVSLHRISWCCNKWNPIRVWFNFGEFVNEILLHNIIVGVWDYLKPSCLFSNIVKWHHSLYAAESCFTWILIWMKLESSWHPIFVKLVICDAFIVPPRSPCQKAVHTSDKILCVPNMTESFNYFWIGSDVPCSFALGNSPTCCQPTYTWRPILISPCWYVISIEPPFGRWYFQRLNFVPVKSSCFLNLFRSQNPFDHNSSMVMQKLSPIFLIFHIESAVRVKVLKVLCFWFLVPYWLMVFKYLKDGLKVSLFRTLSFIWCSFFG